MDLKELMHRESVERVRADNARCPPARFAHLGLAEGYRGRIQALRNQPGDLSHQPGN